MNLGIDMTTTLSLMRQANACPDRYKHLVRVLGDAASDPDRPIRLLDILQHNGPADCLWALRATSEDSSIVARKIAADIAETVLPLYERTYPGDLRPRVAIAAARQYSRGQITSNVAGVAVAYAHAAAAAYVADDVADAAADAAFAAAAHADTDADDVAVVAHAADAAAHAAVAAADACVAAVYDAAVYGVAVYDAPAAACVAALARSAAAVYAVVAVADAAADAAAADDADVYGGRAATWRAIAAIIARHLAPTELR